MHIPLLRFRNDRTPIAWWEWLFAPVLLPLLLVGTVLLLAGLAVFFVPYYMVHQWWRERRFKQLMRDGGRFVSWIELEPRLKAGTGTLVVEQAHKNCVRFWWTEQNVMLEAPTQCPPEQELDYMRIAEPHPFVSWCYRRYLSADSGEAFLTVPPYTFPPGFVEESFFKGRFPELRVLMTVKIV